MTVYILVTRGPRPSNFAEALALQYTSVQARIIKKAAKGLEVATSEPSRLFVITDKTTCIKTLSSLPVLKRFLEKRPSLHVMVPDLPKIFSHCPSGGREALLAELLPFGDRIKMMWFGDGQLSLAQLPETLWPILLDPQSSRKVRRQLLVKPLSNQAMRTHLTEPGRAESVRVRGQRADKLARQLQEIRAELLERTGHATQVEIAELANAQGLLTSRGGPIRPDTVSRALTRIGAE